MDNFKLSENQKNILKILVNSERRNENLLLSDFNKRSINNMHSKGWLTILNIKGNNYVSVSDKGKFVLNQSMNLLETMLFYDRKHIKNSNIK